ncbi:MAG: serine O-acetyltransferase [Gammaproteobacteria bacterium]
MSESPIWVAIRSEAQRIAGEEPMLASYFHATILKHASFETALSFHLASKLDSPTLPAILIREVIDEALQQDVGLADAALADIEAVRERDPAVDLNITPFLYLKGYHGLQSYRVAHWLWNQGREALAFHLQSQMSVSFDMDIHPAARIGRGVMFDHATSIVVGETAVIEDDVSILHEVTLGGSGKEHGDRHPKIRTGVMIGAGAKILGNVEVGKGAKVGAGSVVLEDVPPHTTVVGVPAQIVGRCVVDKPALEMNQSINGVGN